MCYTSPEAKSNILCFADVADMYPVEYDRLEDCFSAKLRYGESKFIRRGKHETIEK